METKDLEFLTVLDVLYDRISRLRVLCGRYPDASLVSDWKHEISILEKFCRNLEDVSSVSPLSDDSFIESIKLK